MAMAPKLIIQGGLVEMKLLRPNWVPLFWKTHNLITDAGRDLAADLLVDPAAVPPSHAGIGDSDVTPVAAQIALQGTEHQRVVMTTSTQGPVVIYQATFTGAIASVLVKEAAIFNAANGGSMLARWLTTEFVLPVGGQFTFKWTAEMARGG